MDDSGLQRPRPKQFDAKRAQLRRGFEASRPIYVPASQMDGFEIERPEGEAAEPPPIVAVTSLSPSPSSTARQRECIASWIAAGCEVFAVQGSEDEIEDDYPGVTFLAIPPSKVRPPYIPISRMVEAVAEQHPKAALLLINADCELALDKRMLSDIAQHYADGCTYFVRHEVYPDGREELHGCGVDGFLFAARFAKHLPQSEVLCLGLPAHDWSSPASMMRANVPLYSPAFRTLLHRVHPLRWSTEDHVRAGKEALRLTGYWSLDDMSRAFRAATKPIRLRPRAIEPVEPAETSK
jgi:hypothetical protein